MKTWEKIVIAFLVLLLLRRPSAAVSTSGATNANPLGGLIAALNGGGFVTPPPTSALPFVNTTLSPDQVMQLNTQAAQLQAAGVPVVFQTTPQNVVVNPDGDLATINATGGTSVLPDPNGIGGGFAT